jgi:hexosaminidase
VLGGQANLWTEYVPDQDTAEYMLLPRLLAMAEALW